MRSFDPPSVFYLIPFTYFQRTRLRSLKEWIFHAWNEWLANCLILFCAFSFDAIEAVKCFLIGYIAFISLYEIGYIANDFYAVRNEANPRMRFGRAISRGMIAFWIVARFALFAAISYYFQFGFDWFLFYIALAIVFALHNLMDDRSLKTYTFLQLAIFRFWAPVFMFLPKEVVMGLLPITVLYYVFNRTLTYMDSKDLLKLPNRTTLSFKLNSGFILLSFSLFWAYYVQSWMAAGIAAYFLLFWVCVKLSGIKLSSD